MYNPKFAHTTIPKQYSIIFVCDFTVEPTSSAFQCGAVQSVNLVVKSNCISLSAFTRPITHLYYHAIF
jgi:hypothetical protein